MRLKYNILWVDDHKEDFKNAELDQDICNYLISQYFDPNLIFLDTVEAAERILDSNKLKFDVICTDYNIDQSLGNEFIKYVRENSSNNTEILFYSAQDDIPNVNYDRISFFKFSKVDAGGYKPLIDKMEELIDLTIEKVQDLTAIRGLVMAEVSELDYLMKDIITEYFNDDVLDIQENRKNALNKRLRTFEKGYKADIDTSKVGCSKKCTFKSLNKNKQELINDIHFDSSKKARIIYHIIKDEKYPLAGLNDFYNLYLKEVINVRNNLAHCVSLINDIGDEVLITKDGETSYDRTKFMEIRSNLQKYNDIFRGLLDYVKNLNKSIVEGK